MPLALTLLRNTMAAPYFDSIKKDSAICFYLFDYFDRMYCSKIATYKEQFKFEKYKVSTSEQHITLTHVDGLSDPFSEKPDLPYLFCIFIQLFPSDRAEDGQQGKDFYPTKTPVFVIQDVVRKKMEDAHIDPEKQCFSICHQYNAGDYCLALRTDDILLGYQIALALRSLSIPVRGKQLYKSVVMDTYTIVGIQTNDISTNAFSEVKAADNHRVALRLAIRNTACLQELQNLCENSFGINGLTGRYDVTITITLEQFQQIYPCLLQKKFNSNIEQQNIEIPIVKWFYDNIASIEFLNERLLVNLPKDFFASAAELFAPMDINKVKAQNNFVYISLSNLRKWTPNPAFLNLQNDFLTRLELLEDVWQSFSSLRYQIDNCINGNMFFAQMCLIIECIEQQLKDISSLMKNTESVKDEVDINLIYRLIFQSFQDLCVWMSQACGSLHNFNIWLQAVNWQSLQAPVYECQMHMDPSKFLIAYTEFARRFLLPYNATENYPKQYILPFFSINFTDNDLYADPLFLLPYQYINDKHIISSNEQEERMLLAIKIPGVDFLSQFYDAIPLICHELSHNLRVVPRLDRNIILGRYIFDRVSTYIVSCMYRDNNCQFQSALCMDSLFYNLVNAISNCLWNEYNLRYGELLYNQNVGVLISLIKTCLINILDCACQSGSFTSAFINESQLAEAMAQLLGMLELDQRNALFKDWISGDRTELYPKYIEQAKQIIKCLLQYIEKELNLSLNLSSEDCLGAPDNFDKTASAEFKRIKDICVAKENADLNIQHISSWFMHLKDANTLFNTLRRYNEVEDKEQQNSRDLFYKKIWEECKNKLESSDEVSKLLWKSGLQNEILNRLGLIQNDETVFKTALCAATNAIPQDFLQSIIDESTTAYREIFADLGMCAFCNFDLFGYLKFFSQYNVVAEEASTANMISPIVDMTSDRVGAVCYVLYKNENTRVDLIKECETYFRSIKNTLLDSKFDASFCDETDIWASNLFKALKEHDLQNLYSFKPSIIEKRLNNNPEALKAFEQVFPQLVFVYQLALNVAFVIKHSCKEEPSPQHAELYEHLYSLRSPLTDSLNKKKDLFDSVKCAGEFHNKRVFQVNKNVRPTEFNDVLAFVKDYYYKNWETYSHTPDLKIDAQEVGANKDLVKAWLDTLIKGSGD